MSKKIKYKDVVRMFDLVEQKRKGLTLILDAGTGEFRYVPKDKFRSVGTIEVGWYEDDQE